MVATRADGVIVGPQELLSVSDVVGIDVVWLAADVDAHEWRDVLVQVRAHGEPVAAQIKRDGTDLLVRLGDRLRGLAPGQSLVAYDGDRVLAQATVSLTGRQAVERTRELATSS